MRAGRKRRCGAWVIACTSFASLCTAAAGLAPIGASAQEHRAGEHEGGAEDAIQGAWTAQRYLMAAGGEHEIRGRIFFAQHDWQVLFFVMDEGGVARRGSAEGGEYALEGSRLVFTHEFNLSGGDEMQGLAAAEFSMTVRDAEGAALEPTTIELEGDALTLHFPSGNRMTFVRR